MHDLDSKSIHSEGGNWHDGNLSRDNIKLICKTVGYTDTNGGKYDLDVLIRLNLRSSNNHVLDMQDICSTPLKFGVLLSNNTRFTMQVKSSR